jgi:Ca-activated chloride channel family protein
MSNALKFNVNFRAVTFANNKHAGNNIVFLIDVSGSMSDPDKLPLLTDSFSLLIEQLGAQDVVSIVTYAGADRIVADSVPGSQHRELARLINRLTAGGSTAGAAGLATAYDLARRNYIEGGNNRVILATDGDFNVGASSVAELTTMITAQRESGVYLSVLGFGGGNLKDSMMESIADHGNGHYAYIDTLDEARKVLVDEFDATMFVVAQDLKVQVEFNGARVAQYRLIGYNNRRLDNQDFADDTKDAGDVGAGHAVTAFYELVAPEDPPVAEQRTYGQTTWGDSDDYFTVAVRYKQPGQDQSTLVQTPVPAQAYTTRASTDFQFAAAVVEFGLIVTDSAYQGQSCLECVQQRAAEAVGEDPYGLRHEFVRLAQAFERLR